MSRNDPDFSGRDGADRRDRDRDRTEDDGDDVIEFGPDDDAEEPWDAHDERRRRDQMAPPREPCECYCLHCRRVFMSDRMWFQRVINDPQGFDGFWMCPTPNCDGAGFTFDIFPTDPDHPANAGWHSCDDEEDEGEGEGEYEEGEFDGEGLGEADDDDGPEAEWDPAESKYKDLDEAFDDGDDFEGEEWKHGLQPGERPADPPWLADARREWEEEQKKYDQPDERPRVVDWGDREDRQRPPPSAGGGKFLDDDIPF